VVDSEDDAEAEEEEEEVNEVDGADVQRVKKASRVEYEENEQEEEEEKEEEKNMEEEEEEPEEIKKMQTESKVDRNKKVPEGFVVLEAPYKVMKLNYFRRVMYNETTNKVRVEFEFPPSMPKLLLVELAEKAAEQVLVNSIQHINRCIVMSKDNEDDEYNNTLQTEGVNFPTVWMYQHLIDVNKIYSNDIWKILETYGVEAARTAIITEITRVFDVYSISVDPRHLALIADYMTQDGAYRPMNRTGMENMESPFQQMSFETTTHFLNNAVLYGNSDSMKTPSACISTGKVMHGGTGSFHIVQPLTI
jgi:DNA-directed RNA polymerase I subunit RPA1